MNRMRNGIADVLIVIALALLAWWLLRGVLSFVAGLFWVLAAAAVVIGLLYLASRIRGGGGGNT